MDIYTRSWYCQEKWTLTFRWSQNRGVYYNTFMVLNWCMNTTKHVHKQHSNFCQLVPIGKEIYVMKGPETLLNLNTWNPTPSHLILATAQNNDKANLSHKSWLTLEHWHWYLNAVIGTGIRTLYSERKRAHTPYLSRIQNRPNLYYFGRMKAILTISGLYYPNIQLQLIR